jgi:hypothetical protein
MSDYYSDDDPMVSATQELSPLYSEEELDEAASYEDAQDLLDGPVRKRRDVPSLLSVPLLPLVPEEEEEEEEGEDGKEEEGGEVNGKEEEEEEEETKSDEGKKRKETPADKKVRTNEERLMGELLRARKAIEKRLLAGKLTHEKAKALNTKLVADYTAKAASFSAAAAAASASGSIKKKANVGGVVAGRTANGANSEAAGFKKPFDVSVQRGQRQRTLEEMTGGPAKAPPKRNPYKRNPTGASSSGARPQVVHHVAASTAAAALAADGKEQPEVVDLTQDQSTVAHPFKVRLDAVWSVGTKYVTITKGNNRDVSWEVFYLERTSLKDDAAKSFAFEMPVRLLGFVSKALSTIYASRSDADDESPHVEFRALSIDELAKVKPDKDGVLNLYNTVNPSYMRTIFVAEAYAIQVEDVTYKTASGLGCYEAITFTRTYTSKDAKKETKTFSVNLPVRLIPLLKSVVDYIQHLRSQPIQQ